MASERSHSSPGTHPASEARRSSSAMRDTADPSRAWRKGGKLAGGTVRVKPA
jgi:hypothetical protein